MIEYGIFSDESADWTAAESLEHQFYSVEEAQAAILDRYSEEEELTIHAVEEPEEVDDEEDEGEEDEGDEEGETR